MADDIPYVLELSLKLPPDETGEPAPVTLNFAGKADSVVRYRLELTGSGTKTLDFGTIPVAGAQLVLVKVFQGTDPVLVYVNGSATPEEIAVGGGKFILSPTPVNGVTSMVLEHTADSSVSVWVLG
jgi:hypothetical protein